MHASLICDFQNSLPGQFQVIYSRFPLRAVANSLSVLVKAKIVSLETTELTVKCIWDHSSWFPYSICFLSPSCDKVSYGVSYIISFYVLRSPVQNKVVLN